MTSVHFEAIYRKHYPRLVQAMFQKTRNMERAQDIAQQAFCVAFDKLEAYRGDAAIYTWIYRIAVNALIDGERRSRRVPFQSLDDRLMAIMQDTLPDRSYDPSECSILVKECLGMVPRQSRQLLIRKYLRHQTVAEIAAVHGIPLGTALSRIQRAKGFLIAAWNVVAALENKAEGAK